MKKPVEIVPGDKQLRLNLYILIAIYILVAISLEPIIDFFLMLGQSSAEPQLLAVLNKKKLLIAHISYGALRILPMLFFAWLGYRILASARIPPARMKFPFSVPLIQGKNARMFGILLLTVALLLISQDLVYLTMHAVE